MKAAQHTVDDLSVEMIHARLAVVEVLVAEHDRLNEMRFKATEAATVAALASQDKAIIKAEDAQREYNVRSNEFRGQLGDQAKTFMARTESLTMHAATAEKFETFNAEFTKKHDALAREIAILRESKSNMDGRMVMLGIGGAALIAIVVSLIGFVLQSFIRSSVAPQPQIIYSPAPPGALLPTTPPAVVPR